MNRRPPFNRLSRSVRALPAEPPIETIETERRELAKELAHGLTDEMERYRKSLTTTCPRLDPNQPPASEVMEGLFALAPESVSFFHLERMFAIDAERAAARWEEIKRTARDQIETGWRAGRALEFLGGSAWERAEFLALRAALSDTWPPRHAGDRLLIDQMAQYEFLRLKWVAVLAMQSREPALPRRCERPEGEPRQATAVEKTAEAVRNVERLQRLFQNALRLLLQSRVKRAADSDRVNYFPTLMGQN